MSGFFIKQKIIMTSTDFKDYISLEDEFDNLSRKIGTDGLNVAIAICEEIKSNPDKYKNRNRYKNVTFENDGTLVIKDIYVTIFDPNSEMVYMSNTLKYDGESILISGEECENYFEDITADAQMSIVNYLLYVIDYIF